MREALSTERPEPLRLAGSATLSAGGLLLGLGALLEWASIGFPRELDPTRSVVGHVRGIDVWEGWLVLGAALVTLGGLLAMRVLGSEPLRRLIAVAIVVVGLGSAGLAVADAATAETRFVARDGLDRYASAVAEETGLAFEQVRSDLEEVFLEQLEVERGIGLWLTILGGVSSGAGGILSLVLLGRRRSARSTSDAT